jgi:hypothetical protein
MTLATQPSFYIYLVKLVPGSKYAVFLEVTPALNRFLFEFKGTFLTCFKFRKDLQIC